MGLDNLFIEGPQFSETSMIKLPQAPDKWNEVIVSMVKEKYPMTESLPMVVQFKEMSEDTGTAIGSIAITHPTLKKTCYIPIIIKGGMMFPLDIWQDEKQTVRPITEDTFDTYFFNEKTFDALEKKKPDPMSQYFSDPSLWQSTYPPLQGRYAYASAGGALLGMMLENATKADAANFDATLEKDPGSLLAYKKTGNLDIIKSAAVKTAAISQAIEVPKPMEDKGLLPIFITVRKDPKKYTVLSAHNGQFVTKSSFSSQDQMKNYFSQNGHLTSHDDDFMNQVEHNGTKSFKMPEDGNVGVFIQDFFGPAPEKVKKFGVYRVKRTSDGVMEKGFVIPQVIDFDQKPLGQMMFLGGTTASMQSSIAGYPVPTEADMRSMWGDLKDSPIQIGQTGVFLLTGDGSAVVTEPIQVIRIDGDNGFRACNFAGKVFKVKRWSYNEGHTLQKISKYTSSDYTEYSIPSKMVWVPINNLKSVSSSGAEFVEKTASEQKRDHDPVRVRWTGLTYEMTGKNFEKVATTFNYKNMDEDEVKFVLRTLGSSPAVATDVIKVAHNRGLAVIHGLKQMEDPAPLYKKAAELKQNFAKFCGDLKCNLIKEASPIGDKQTVDAILSLNFINPENIRKLVEAMPVMMKAHFKLAEMVLAARLGAEEVPHDPTVVCMQRMTEVLKGLRLLDHSNSDIAMQAKNVAKAKKGAQPQNLVQVGAI